METRIFHIERQRHIIETFEIAAASGEEACHLVSSNRVSPLDVDTLQEKITAVEPKGAPLLEGLMAGCAVALEPYRQAIG